MIIWGWRGLKLKGKSGQFYCPTCATDRTYRINKIQRFFTLYFIPLIPLQVVQESVECQTCHNNFVMAALHNDPRTAQVQLRLEIADCYQRVLYHFAAMSGRRDALLVHKIVTLFPELDGGEVTADAVLTGLERDTQNLVPAAAFLARNLNERGREIVVRGAIIIAVFDGKMGEAKRAGLADFAKSLGMSEAHFTGVLAGVSEQNPPPAPALNA